MELFAIARSLNQQHLALEMSIQFACPRTFVGVTSYYVNHMESMLALITASCTSVIKLDLSNR